MITRTHDARWLLTVLSPLMLLVQIQGASAQSPAQSQTSKTAAGGSLAFTAAADGTWRFDTGVLHGQLRTEQLAFGLHDVQYRPTGERLSGPYGLLNIYRVFSDGKRYGHGAWDWPSRVVRRNDGAVAIDCAAEPTRPFGLRGVYRWHDPATVDLTVEVTPQQDLQGFEVFVASYFTSIFSEARAYVEQDPQAAGKPGLLEATEEYGTWLSVSSRRSGRQDHTRRAVEAATEPC